MKTHDFEAAYKVLYDHQQWRMGNDDYPPTEPKELSAAMEVAFKALRLATDVQAGKVKVVPVEATDYMHRKGGEAFYDSKSDSFLGRIPDVHKAMLAAAPHYDWGK